VTLVRRFKFGYAIEILIREPSPSRSRQLTQAREWVVEKKVAEGNREEEKGKGLGNRVPSFCTFGSPKCTDPSRTETRKFHIQILTKPLLNLTPSSQGYLSYQDPSFKLSTSIFNAFQRNICTFSQFGPVGNTRGLPYRYVLL